MTRKDFILIAEALRRVRQNALDQSNLGRAEGVLLAAYELADELTKTNDRFNRARFLDAVRGVA
jgi:hypothetical protein